MGTPVLGASETNQKYKHLFYAGVNIRNNETFTVQSPFNILAQAYTVWRINAGPLDWGQCS